MVYFDDAAEVDRLVGGVLRLGAQHAEVAAGLGAARAQLRIVCRDPDCELTISLTEPMVVTFGACDVMPDVTLALSGDLLDLYWRGSYSMLDGLACGEVTATGPVSKVLKVLPHAAQLFPLYRNLVAGRDRSASAASGRPVG